MTGRGNFKYVWLEIKIWEVPKSQERPHGLKYSFVYICGTERVVGYDNSEGKGQEIMERFHEGCSPLQGGKIMKVKNIRIAIKDEKELFNEVKAAWKKAERRERVKKHEAIYFENLDAMRKILTEGRLRILKVIKKEHPASIYELANKLQRDIKNTFDDVQFLAQGGLVELKKTNNVRGRTTPEVNYDKILLEIQV